MTRAWLVLALASCSIVSAPDVATYACEPDGTCAVGTTCCADGFCRARCGCSPACASGSSCVNGECEAGCTAGTSCSTNPGAPCLRGTTVCASGTPVCSDGTGQAAGTGCGTGRVCDGDGGCIACIDGAACSTNPDPCKGGKLHCGGGAPSCTDDAAKGPGESCGVDKVCSPAGACIDCVASGACLTNPAPCLDGTASCAGGVPACTDTPTLRAPGSTCGGGKVCNATGACVMCVAGQACATNPSPCKSGVMACALGAPACVDAAANLASTTACDGGFCNGAGACAACAQGSACTTNPNVCAGGVLTWDSGSATCGCADDAAHPRDGAACDGGLCRASACAPCAVGQACASNPSAPCRAGSFALNGSRCVCNDGAAVNNNGACPGGRCYQGTCHACAEGAPCPTAECYLAQLGWSPGVCQCMLVGTAPDNSACSDVDGNPGKCMTGACCSGCVDQLTAACDALGTQNASQCGHSGDICHDCGAPEPDCTCDPTGTCQSMTAFQCTP